MALIDEYLARNPYKAPQQVKKKGNFVSNLLPTIGGIGGGAAGGAAGGALAGTALLPGVGTAVGGLIGALAGGAGGGAAGKVAQNKLEGNSLGNGVGGQALEQGVLSAGPLRLLKTGKAVAGAAKAGATLEDALATANNAAGSTGLLTRGREALANKGAQYEARSGGFGVGEKLPGQQPLGYYDSAKVIKTLKSEGIKPGTPEARLKQVEDALATRGKQIDLHLTTNNEVLGTATKQKIVQNYLNTIEEQPGVDDLVRKQAQNFANNFLKQVEDGKGTVTFRRGLDKQAINFNQNPDSALVAKQIAARTFRDALSDATNKMAPGIKPLNKSYSSLVNAKEFLTGGAKAVSDNSQSAAGGLIGRTLAGDTAQGLKSVGGSLAQKAAPSGGSNPFSLGAVSGRALPIGVAQASINSSNSAGQNPNMDTSTTTTGMINNSNIPTDYQNSDNLSSMSQDSTNGSPYSRENLLYDIQRDPKNAEKYISYYQELEKAYAPPEGQKLSASQQTRAVAAQNALGDIPLISDAITTGKLGGAKAIPGSGSAIGRRLLGTEDLDAALFNIADNILRARSGAAAPEAEVQRFKDTFLPGPLDSPQAKKLKLDRAVRELQGYVNPTGGGGVMTLEDALLQQQGG